MTQTVVRTGDPREVVALAEHTLGFRPQESLVLVSLRGPRRRTGLVARVDLSAVGEQGLLDALAGHALADGAADAVVLVLTGQPAPPPGPAGRTRLDALPHAAAVGELRAALGARGVAPVQAWLVSGGRLVSFTCDGACCPPAGRPGEADATRVAAEMVLRGSAVDPDRSAWQLRESAALRPAGEEVIRRVEAAARRRPDPAGASGVLAWWCDVLAGTARAARAGRSPDEAAAELVVPEAAGRVLAALEDHRLRDAVLLTLVPGAQEAAEVVAAGGPGAGAAFGRALGADRPCPPPDPEVLVAAEALVRALVRLSPPRRRAEPLALLAWASWWRGAGPQAALAAEMALRARPGHGLADLVLRTVEAGIPPDWARRARGARPDG
jgi:Domain of unknown function (DUF4192)